MPDVLALTFVLALNEADSPMLLWLVVGGLMALGPVIHSYIKVYEWFKGTSVDTSEFITQEQFAEAKANRDRELADTITFIKDQLKAVSKTVAEINSDMPAIHRALGRLEGHDEADRPRTRRPS